MLRLKAKCEFLDALEVMRMTCAADNEAKTPASPDALHLMQCTDLVGSAKAHRERHVPCLVYAKNKTGIEPIKRTHDNVMRKKFSAIDV
jgi:hypothetical protein